LLDLDILVTKHLDLLAIIPKTGIKTVQEYSWFWSPSIFQRLIITQTAKANINFLQVTWVVCREFYFPVMNSMKW